MARPERFELPTTWFVARYSIQLSYGRVRRRDYRDSRAPGRACRACRQGRFTLRFQAGSAGQVGLRCVDPTCRLQPGQREIALGRVHTSVFHIEQATTACDIAFGEKRRVSPGTRHRQPQSTTRSGRSGNRDVQAALNAAAAASTRVLITYPSTRSTPSACDRTG